MYVVDEVHMTEFVCIVVRRDPNHCWISSILALWQFDKEIIDNLKKTEILKVLNNPNLTEYVIWI